MLSYLISFIWSDDEIHVDPKQLRQKYLVLQQIKDHKIRLKSIARKPLPKRPTWVKKKDVLP